ncbi:ABC transporter substrate-binding protein [Natrinema sp. 74]|uniref:ABC transporter substrate-binding protein n=1 Tax=Natrinema sp. 74 TaxID=3384159 RepID=UPI0038D39760
MARDGKAVGASTDSHGRISRRRVLETSGAAMITAGLAGCSTLLGNGSADSGITVVSYNSSSAAKDAWNSIAKTYEEETGNTVNMQYTGFTDVISTVSQMIRGGNPPDLVIANMNVAGTLFAQDQLAPLTDIVDDLYEGETPEETFITGDDDEVYAPVYSTTLHGLDVRRDLVKQAGGTMPDDWVNHDMGLSDFAQWGQQIKDQTGKSLWAYSSAASGRGAMQGMNLLFMNGVHIYSGTRGNYEVVLDKGENKRRAAELLSYFKNDLKPVSEGSPNYSWTDMQELYVNGKAATVNYGVGRMLALLDNRGKTEQFNNTIPINQPHDNLRDDGGLIQQDHGTEMLLSASQNKDAAKEWIKTFHNSDGYIDFLHTTPFYKNPPTPEGMRNEAWRDNPIIQQRSEIIDFHIGLIEEGYAHPHAVAMGDGGVNIPHLQAYQAGEYGKMMQYVTVEGQSPEEAVSNTADALREYVSE